MLEINGEIGKYRILQKIGSGGFGTVYLAEDTILKAKRAIKIPHRTSTNMNKLLQESIVQAKLLDHPHIVKLLTVDIINDTIVMVMEYIEGKDLEKIIDENEKLSLDLALNYFRQILSALDYAHRQNILHRDIRPSNILITRDNQIKITDFGTSKLLKDKEYATTRIGSPPYMAPEQFEGRAILCSDIYSCGCIFYEMITGFPPIISANPVEIYNRAKAGNIIPLIKKAPKISSGLNAIIMRCLEADFRKRYSRAADVLNELDQLENKKSEPKVDFNIKEAQERIRARETGFNFRSCWNCRREILATIERCPHCGEKQ